MLARKAMKAILFSPLRIQRTDILSKRPMARFQDLKTFYNFFLIMIDFNFNHLDILWYWLPCLMVKQLKLK